MAKSLPDLAKELGIEHPTVWRRYKDIYPDSNPGSGHRFKPTDTDIRIIRALHRVWGDRDPMMTKAGELRMARQKEVVIDGIRAHDYASSAVEEPLLDWLVLTEVAVWLFPRKSVAVLFVSMIQDNENVIPRNSTATVVFLGEE